MLYSLLTETEHELAPIIMHPLAFAGIAAATFIVLGLVTWSFRDVSNRHATTDARADHQHEQH